MFKKKQKQRNFFLTEEKTILICIIVTILCAIGIYSHAKDISEQKNIKLLEIASIQKKIDSLENDYKNNQRILALIKKAPDKTNVEKIPTNKVTDIYLFIDSDFSLIKNKRIKLAPSVNSLLLVGKFTPGSYREALLWREKIKRLFGWNHIAMISVKPLIFIISSEQESLY